MRSLVRLSLAIDALNRRVAKATAWSLVAMVAVGAYNAVGRYVERDVGMRLTSNGLLELQWYLFGVLFLLGAPYTLRRDEHVRVDVLYGGLTRRGKHWTDAVGGLVLLLPFALFAFVYSVSFAAESWAQDEWSSDPGGLPRWPLKLVLPVGFLLLTLQGLSEVVKRIAVLRGMTEHEVGLDETREQERTR